MIRQAEVLSKVRVEKIGKVFSQSKIRYTWPIKINGSNRVIQLLHSKLSKKIQVRIDGKQYITKQGIPSKDFRYIIHLNGEEIKITGDKNGEGFKLYINKEDIDTTIEFYMDTYADSRNNSPIGRKRNISLNPNHNLLMPQNGIDPFSFRKTASDRKRHTSYDNRTVKKKIITIPKLTGYKKEDWQANIQAKPNMEFAIMDSDVFFDKIPVLQIKDDSIDPRLIENINKNGQGKLFSFRI